MTGSSSARRYAERSRRSWRHSRYLLFKGGQKRKSRKRATSNPKMGRMTAATVSPVERFADLRLVEGDDDDDGDDEEGSEGFGSDGSEPEGAVDDDPVLEELLPLAPVAVGPAEFAVAEPEPASERVLCAVCVPPIDANTPGVEELSGSLSLLEEDCVLAVPVAVPV